MSVVESDYKLVVDGFISNEPGPYTVQLYRSRPLKADLDRIVPIKGAIVRLLDNLGNSELMVEQDDGVYQTSKDGMRGQVGNSYHIEIKTSDGRRMISEPDELLPVGTVDSIYYQFQSQESGDVFKVFANASSAIGRDNFIRLRMVSTYKAETYPQYRTKPTGSPFVTFPDPFPCSGYIVNPMGELEKIGDCQCCTCWISMYDKVPVLINNRFLGSNVFSNVEVGNVPVNPEVFVERVHVEIQQLSLTPASYLYWELVRAQKLGVADIFQPPSSQLTGNVKMIDSNEKVFGIFWAAGISKRSLFIDRKDSQLPYVIPGVENQRRNVTPCQNLQHSTNIPPPFWN